MDELPQRRHRRGSMTTLPWTVPPELAPYTRYTTYTDRAEELVNSDATFVNNAVVASMRAETAAEWRLLETLHRAGLLKPPTT